LNWCNPNNKIPQGRQLVVLRDGFAGRRMDRQAIKFIIGKNIRHRRNVAGLSLEAVASQIGITYQQLQKYEKGKDSISADKLVQLAPILKCTVDDLCSEAAVSGSAILTDNPWNPYRVEKLVSDFSRIRSRAVRNKVCAIVEIVADSVASQSGSL
jgi:transcriptional regulator with XRE-family HTH domain